MTGNAGALTKRVVEFVRGSFMLNAIAISNVDYSVCKKLGGGGGGLRIENVSSRFVEDASGGLGSAMDHYNKVRRMYYFCYFF